MLSRVMFRQRGSRIESVVVAGVHVIEVLDVRAFRFVGPAGATEKKVTAGQLLSRFEEEFFDASFPIGQTFPRKARSPENRSSRPTGKCVCGSSAL